MRGCFTVFAITWALISILPPMAWPMMALAGIFALLAIAWRKS